MRRVCEHGRSLIGRVRYSVDLPTLANVFAAIVVMNSTARLRPLLDDFGTSGASMLSPPPHSRPTAVAPTGYSGAKPAATLVGQ